MSFNGAIGVNNPIGAIDTIVAIGLIVTIGTIVLPMYHHCLRWIFIFANGANVATVVGHHWSPLVPSTFVGYLNLHVATK